MKLIISLLILIQFLDNANVMGQEHAIALAKKAKENGFKFLLDYHYSDTWADPGKQYLPKAWTGLSHSRFVKAVFEYTRETIKAFREAGVLPEMVQIGNEVINGMMLPDGKIPANWDNFAELVQAGINGVNAGCDSTEHALAHDRHERQTRWGEIV
jgi:arabinogalactan endo-1,4-beta-galactosidase